MDSSNQPVHRPHDAQRPLAVRIAAMDVRGRAFELDLQGLPARVFLHEYDHLQVSESRDCKSGWRVKAGRFPRFLAHPEG